MNNYPPEILELFKTNFRLNDDGTITNVKTGRTRTARHLGYVRTSIKRNKKNHIMLGHRLAWLLHYGELAPGAIDHINQDRADNRISNLRLADKSENTANSKKQRNTSSAYKGVYKKANRPGWASQIQVRGQRIHLGYFLNEKCAAIAYNSAAIQHFGVFAHINEVTL